MKGYSASKVFNERELQVYHEAVRIVDMLPERWPRDGDLLRCHEVARVVGNLLDLEVVDGTYELGAEHSWCIVSQKVGEYRWWSILDPYVVGRFPMVQLIAVVPAMPNRYTPGEPRDDIRQDVIDSLLRFKERR